MHYIGCHCHTCKSNIRLVDSINKTKDLIKTAVKMGYSGIAITDHEVLSAHVEAIKVVKELKKKEEMPQDFKLILGNEIYLVDSLEDVRDRYKSGVTKFPHFVLLACDTIGHRQLRELSSQAWSQSFKTGLMERVPLEKRQLENVLKENRGHIIGSTACLGGELAIYSLALIEAEKQKNDKSKEYFEQKILSFLNWGKELFGRDKFFVELQPAFSEEQMSYNKKAISFAGKCGLKTIVTTDAHFLRPEDLMVHSAYLNSKDGDRETESFYASCFVQSTDEIKERLGYNENLSDNEIKEAINNTLLIGQMVEDYDLYHTPIIPRIDIPDFEVRHIFKPAYKKYEYIKKMAYSENIQDRYLIKLIEDGFNEKFPSKTLNSKRLHELLARIDVELMELWKISESLKNSMASYYVTVRELINIIWDDCGGNSIVGIARGSAAGFLINYLLGITQFNPMDYGLPHWRHLHHSRPDMPDIDIDSEGLKRQTILRAFKDKFGERRVLNIATFGTEGSKSAILTACRGLKIDNDTAMHIASLIPFERGSNWSLPDCLQGNEEKQREPVTEFINEIEKYENLKEVALKIEGVENKRSIHAGGIYIFNDDFVETNAMMKAPNGQWITQFSMSDSEYMGNTKYDNLTVEGIDKIRESMNLLLEYGEIEWQGSLKKTYDKYFHPDKLEYNNAEMWKKLGEGEVLDLFQFNTQIGIETAKKVKPSNLLETAVANSLMRLMADGSDMQPVDQYVKFKNDISLWYDEMKDYGLNDDEIKVLEKYLKNIYGVADTQEVIMMMVMDEKIAAFDVVLANKARKAIAKKSEKEMKEVRGIFFEYGKRQGTSENLLNYIWNVQIKRQLSYSFSLLHTLAYSLIALQELNIYFKYNPLYWNTAVLTVNSGSSEEDALDEDEEDNESDGTQKKNRSTDYGKVASAIGMMQQHGVNIGLPNINKAAFGFKPDFEQNQIVFGLKGINGIGDDIVQMVISNRTYESFEDFYKRMFETSFIKKSQMIQLIKAGSFDSFDDRRKIMHTFIRKICPPKEKLNMQNFNMIVQNNLLPENMKEYSTLFLFKKHVTKKVYRTEGKDKQYVLDGKSQQYFEKHFSNECIVDYINGKPIISEKIFKKEYDKKMETVKEWLNESATLETVNKYLYKQDFLSLAEGTISKWEMDSLSFYYTEHELLHVNKDKYDIVNFNILPEEPIIEEYIQYSNGTQRPKFQLSCIVGTVLDKNKNKHTVTLLTTDGVITVKYYDGAFAHYNRQVSKVNPDGTKQILEKSWFTRGNKLFICGYRRGSQFKPHRYSDTRYRHTTMLITNVLSDGSLKVKQERTKGN